MKKPAKAAKAVRKQPKKAAAPTAKHPQQPKHPQHKPPVSKAVQHARHTTAVKAAKTRAANAKKAKAHPRRGLRLGTAIAYCAAEAVARSAWLAGWPAGDLDALALHVRVPGRNEAGAPILATLETAAEFGIAGFRPVSFAPVDLDDPAAVILGLSLPGSHAVTVSPSGNWWSWGEIYSPSEFPDAVIEEAWEVTW